MSKRKREASSRFGSIISISTRLLKHQEQALQWLIEREKSDDSVPFWTGPRPLHGGILNDSEGLGKSLAILALISRDKKDISGTRTNGTLILVDNYNNMKHWLNQVKSHVHGKFKVKKHSKKQSITRDVIAEDAKKYDLVLVSYNYADTVCSLTWRRIIFEDAHVIEKFADEKIQQLKNLNAERTWALTGKPIQNGSYNLVPLLSVLGFQQLSSTSNFNDLMATISLRRTREALGLPPRNIDIQFVDFRRRERQQYDKEMDGARSLLIHFESLNHVNVNENDNDSDTPNENEKVWHRLCEKTLKLIKICTHRGLCRSGPITGFSSKITALVKHLIKSREECPDRKSVIFSEAPLVLSFLEGHLRETGFKTLMGIDKGSKCNEKLQGQDGATVLLAPLIACMDNTIYKGANLTACSAVYLMEPCFSPEIEERIIELVHCIGQDKPINIVKFIINNSIEEKILKLQERKRENLREAFDVKASSFKLDDIQFVLKE